MSAIEILIDEHSLISRMVKVLARLHRDLDGVNELKVNVLPSIVDFFENFVDKNHHAKEEDFLFLELEKHGINPEACRLETLRSEHKQARILMTILRSAIGKYKNRDPAARSEISTTMKKSIDLYSDHIWRENFLLFPIAEKSLQKSELEDVAKSYNEVEKRLDPDFRVRYENFLKSLESDSHSSR